MSNDHQVIKQTVPPAHPPQREGFWSRRVMRPIVNQLTQGVSPHKITLTLALGATLGVFPIFGITSLLCLLLGAPLKLNQVILQSANWMVTWVHPLLLIFLCPPWRNPDGRGTHGICTHRAGRGLQGISRGLHEAFWDDGLTRHPGMVPGRATYFWDRLDLDEMLPAKNHPSHPNGGGTSCLKDA